MPLERKILWNIYKHACRSLTLSSICFLLSFFNLPIKSLFTPDRGRWSLTFLFLIAYIFSLYLPKIFHLDYFIQIRSLGWIVHFLPWFTRVCKGFPFCIYLVWPIFYLFSFSANSSSCRIELSFLTLLVLLVVWIQ